jgi:hypothetical protein
MRLLRCRHGEFRMLCVFVVIEHGTRRLARMNVITPSAA